MCCGAPFLPKQQRLSPENTLSVKGTMFAIQSTNAKGWRWISGVVVSRAEAELSVAAIPEAVRHLHKIVELPGSEFPLFMIETDKFEFGGIELVRQRLREVEPTGVEDAVHFNIYAFKSRFLAEVPGRDEMGRVLHWHITDDTLRLPRAEVFDSELAEVGNDA